MPDTNVTIIVPARGEIFLQKTISDLLANATGDIEIYACLDGYWPDPPLIDDPRLHVIHFSKPKGMRACVNAAANLAKGKYLMKTDGHCMFGQGYDEILAHDCADNWVVIPRRYSLDAENWARTDKECIDSEYCFYPFTPGHFQRLHDRPWWGRGRRRRNILIDVDMTFQGSCWFMSAEHFNKRLGGLNEAMYGGFWNEPQEIGFKTQLGPWGGAIMRNKKTWYAHLHKGHRYGRMYHQEDGKASCAFAMDYWWNNKWEERIHDLEWMIDQFMPIPNWPDDWKEQRYGKQPS